MFAQLGEFVVRRRVAVVIAWVIMILAGGVVGSAAFEVLSSDFGAGEASESGQVAQHLGLEPIAELDGVIAVTDYWSTGVEELRAADGRAALAVVTLTGGLEEEAELELAHLVSDMARDIDATDVLVGGNLLVGEQFETERDLLRGEAIALPIAIAIIAMVIILGGLFAAGMPLLVALSGVVARRARRRHPGRRRLDLHDRRREHARHRRHGARSG